MEYSEDFKSRVLSVIDDSIVAKGIKDGKIDIGTYLMENAFKGIDSKIILDCLYVYEDGENILLHLAARQEKMKALYQEYFEYYVMKAGSTLKQSEINEEQRRKKYKI